MNLLNPESPVGLRPLPHRFPITSKFGDYRPEISKEKGLKDVFHKGVDFGSIKDNRGCIKESILKQPVMAYLDGIVRVAHDNGDGFGNRLVVEHDKFLVLYCHLHEMFYSVGDRITQGKAIGLVGNTGKSTAAHLHFEVRKTIEGKLTSIEPYFYPEKEA